MKLWLIEPVNPRSKPWQPWYDKAFAFVIRAEDEKAARQLAADSCGDEGSSPWMDDTQGNL
jgi:hypothetical protein